MKIKDIRVVVSCPGRNFVTVKVVTDSGTYGLGDATVNGREMAVVAYLDRQRRVGNPAYDRVTRLARSAVGLGGRTPGGYEG